MKEVFETYNKKTITYYFLLSSFILPAFISLISQIGIVHVDDELFKFICFFGILMFAAYLTLNNSFLKMYIKNGEITIADEFIEVRGIMVKIKEINKLVYKADDYKGNRRGTSDGSGNSIEIYNQTGKIYDLRFAINSKQQKENLDKILGKLKENGLNITPFGF